MMKSWIVFFSWLVMTKIHAMKQLFKKFCQHKVLAPFTTTICTCLYTTFVHDASMYIHIIYINAHIHQGLNLKPHGDALKS
jgi:hypothetical protein